MKFKEDLTIVIPSVGESTLENTINSILENTVLPKLILIILPKGYKYELKIKSDIIKIYNSNKKGQVNQRIFGFKKSITKYVMQLDSDIIVNKYTIEKLIHFISKNNDEIAVAPILRPLIKKKISKNSFLTKSKNLLINGKLHLNPGKITDIGYNSWFEEKEITNDNYNVEWLPGGCILHKRKNLIIDNYYPFINKAYCEDVIHSLQLKKKDIKLFLLTSVDVQYIGYNNKTNLLQRLSEFKVRKFILKKINGNRIRFLIWYFFYVIKFK